MSTKERTIEDQINHPLPPLPGNERFHTDRYGSVIQGTIEAQVKHYYDPRTDFADRSHAVTELIVAHVVLSLVQAGMDFPTAHKLSDDIYGSVFDAMIVKGFIFEGKGKLAI